MNFLDWLTSRFSSRGKSLTKLRRGMARATKGDHQTAIQDYTALIDASDTPRDVKAMAMYNRALMWSAQQDRSRAIHDLNEVLAMAATPPDVKTEARRKLERMRRESLRTDSQEPPE